MSIQYGNLHVDERYLRTLAPNLFYRSWLVPGITYQDVITDGEGGVYWHKLTSTAVAVGTPGRDFSDVAAADTLIPAIYNNNYQSSKKIYGVQAAAVDFAIGEEYLALAVNEIGESRNQSGLACLISEGTTSGTTTAITASNFKAQFLAERTAIVEAKGTPDVVLCSPSFFATMLDYAGAQFLPASNEDILRAARGGQVGDFMGLRWVEVPGFSASADAEYYNYSGSKVTVDDSTVLNKVDFIVYDSKFFGCGDNFSVARIIDSENFAGTKAQAELNTAFRVIDGGQVRIRKHA